MSNFIHIFIAPVITKVPLVLDVSVSKPSELINQYIKNNQTAYETLLSEENTASTPVAEHLHPTPNSWVLLGVFRGTVMTPDCVDKLGSRFPRSTTGKEKIIDDYIVIPMEALCDHWWFSRKGTYLGTFLACFFNILYILFDLVRPG